MNRDELLKSINQERTIPLTLGPWVDGLTTEQIAQRLGMKLGRFLALNPGCYQNPPKKYDRVNIDYERK